MRRIIWRCILNRITIGDLIYIMKKLMKRDKVKMIEFYDRDGKIHGKVRYIKKDAGL